MKRGNYMKTTKYVNENGSIFEFRRQEWNCSDPDTPDFRNEYIVVPINEIARNELVALIENAPKRHRVCYDFYDDSRNRYYITKNTYICEDYNYATYDTTEIVCVAKDIDLKDKYFFHLSKKHWKRVLYDMLRCHKMA